MCTTKTEVLSRCRMKKIKHHTIKLFLIILVALLVFLSVFFLIQKQSKILDYRRIALVDTIGENYIFRGNNPLVKENEKKVFAYDELTSYFNDILKKEGHTTLDDYYLIDISLLDFDQYSEIMKESQFFIKHPELGMTINISTLSLRLLIEKNSSNPSFVTQEITNHYNLWIKNTIEKVHKIASNQGNKPTVIYIHCDSGRDRTGLITASYRMLFKNIDLANVRLKNIAEVGRNSRNSYNQAMQSFCLHVKEKYKKSDDYCI